MKSSTQKEQAEMDRESGESAENHERPIIVTPKAARMVAQYFKDKEKSPIRLFVKLGGCGIRSFGVALEKPKKNDVVFEIEGFQYIIDKTLLQHVQPVTVHSDGYGFRISGSGIYPHSGCGSCGFMCQDGSRCSGKCDECDHICAHGRRRLAARGSSGN